MTRSDEDRLDRPDESEVPAKPRRDPHPSEILPGIFGRRLGMEGVPQKDDTPASPSSDLPEPSKPTR